MWPRSTPLSFFRPVLPMSTRLNRRHLPHTPKTRAGQRALELSCVKAAARTTSQHPGHVGQGSKRRVEVRLHA